MADEDQEHPAAGKYYEPQERMTRLAALATEAMMASPEWGDDIQAAFMLHDQDNGSGAALLGYPDGKELGFEAISDVVQHISNLFKSSGITMKLSTVMAPPEDQPDGEPASENASEERVVLTLSAPAPDERIKTVCEAVKAAIEQTSGLAETKMIIAMDLGPMTSVLLHHGYPSHHAMVHALFDTFKQAISLEGGQVAVIPVIEPGAWN